MTYLSQCCQEMGICAVLRTATATSLHTSPALPPWEGPVLPAMWTRSRASAQGQIPGGIQDQLSALCQEGGCCKVAGPSPQPWHLNSEAPSSFHSPKESLYTGESGIFLHLCPNLSDVALHHGVCQCKRSSFKLEQSSEII